MQHAGDWGTDQAGHDAGGEAPRHDQRGRRLGQQVGRHSGHRHAAVPAGEQRRHGHLRGQGHAQSRGDATRHGEVVPQRAGQHQDAGRGGHRQLEPEHADEHRVDEHEGGHRERQCPDAGDRSPEHPGGDGDGRHGRCPQHGGLESGDDAEQPDDRQRRHPPAPQPEAAQHRHGHRQHEGHVLARHHQEVAEAGAAEVVGHGGRLTSVVAQHEAGEQGPLVGGQRRRAPKQDGPQPVGHARDGVAVAGRPHLARVEPPDDVATGGPVVTRRPGRRATAYLDHLPGDPPGHGRPGPTPRPQVEVVARGTHLGVHGAAEPVGIGDQGGPTGPFARRGGPSPEPRLGREAGGQQGEHRAEQQRAAEGERHHGGGGQRPHRQGEGQPGAERGGDRQRDHPAVAQPADAPGAAQRRCPDRRGHTRTRSRSWASLASPMPRTWARSSTEWNGPLRWR